MIPETIKKKTMTHLALGKNQRFVLNILSDLVRGRNVKDIRYYGGSVSKGERCVSIGRECKLYLNVPYWIVDVRHTGALFRQKHGERLGYHCLRSFNRTMHGLLKRGLISEVPVEYIKQGKYQKPPGLRFEEPLRTTSSAIRFVSLVPDASGIIMDGKT
jgi:hypothetical protein